METPHLEESTPEPKTPVVSDPGLSNLRLTALDGPSNPQATQGDPKTEVAGAMDGERFKEGGTGAAKEELKAECPHCGKAEAEAEAEEDGL